MAHEFSGSSDWSLNESSIKSSCARAIFDTIFAVFCRVFSVASGVLSLSWIPSMSSRTQICPVNLKDFKQTLESLHKVTSNFTDHSDNKNKDLEHALWRTNGTRLPRISKSSFPDSIRNLLVNCQSSEKLYFEALLVFQRYKRLTIVSKFPFIAVY